MRPLTVLLAIVMGSCVAMAVSMSMTGIVFLLMPEYSARLAAEHAPLLKGLAWSWSLVVVAVAAFVGEVRQHPWRRRPQWLLLALVALLGWMYWP